MADSRKAKQGAERYRTFLVEKGYRAWITSTGNVAFYWEGRTYIIVIDEKDEAFFHLTYPSFWRSDTDQELTQMRDAALAVAAEIKAVKIFLVDDIYAYASIELFCVPPQTVTAVFDRCLKTLHAGVKKFDAKMKEPCEQTDHFVFYLPKYTVGGN